MPSLRELDLGELADLGAVLMKAGLDAGMARRLIKRPELADQCVALLRKASGLDLFCSPGHQLMLFQKWNDTYELGFTAEQFQSLGEPPSNPEGPLVTVILAWSLDTPEATADKAWQIVRDAHGDGHWESPKRLLVSLPEGMPFTPHTLSWQILDLGADQRKIDETWFRQAIRDHHRAHIQVIQAAAYFPDWVKALGTPEVPSVYLAGCRTPSRSGGSRSPLGLHWYDERGGLVALHAMPFHDGLSALPTYHLA